MDVLLTALGHGKNESDSKKKGLKSDSQGPTPE